MRKKLIILFIGIGSFTLFAQQRDHRTREYIAPVRIVSGFRTGSFRRVR